MVICGIVGYVVKSQKKIGLTKEMLYIYNFIQGGSANLKFAQQKNGDNTHIFTNYV